MKISKNKKTSVSLPLFITIIVAVILIGGAVYAAVTYLNARGGSDKSLTPEDANSKKDFIENTDDKGQPSDPGNDNTKAALSFTLNSEGNNVIVKTQIPGLASGTCTLTIGDYSETVNILYQPEFSTCEGFSVDMSSINPSDTFTITATDGTTTLTESKKLNE